MTILATGPAKPKHEAPNTDPATAETKPNGPAPTNRATQGTKPTGTTLHTIRHLGRLLDDLERVRIMNGNRIGAMERATGEALPHLHAIQDALHHIEHQAELELVRAWRKHPLAAWAKAQHGVGEKSIARLIAEIGDPYMATIVRTESIEEASPEESGQLSSETHGTDASESSIPVAEPINQTTNDPHLVYVPESATAVAEPIHHTPRLISQLWQYCGVGKPGRIPAGATQTELLARGKPRAKKQLYLIATGMLKAGNRTTYDNRRAATTERTHKEPCPQCHAKPGDPWRDGHKHADALRIVAKQFLRELWLEAERLHATNGTHRSNGA